MCGALLQVSEMLGGLGKVLGGEGFLQPPSKSNWVIG